MGYFNYHQIPSNPIIVVVRGTYPLWYHHFQGEPPTKLCVEDPRPFCLVKNLVPTGPLLPRGIDMLGGPM
jgi:hypothetical protein